jgi:hypothetical protein
MIQQKETSNFKQEGSYLISVIYLFAHNGVQHDYAGNMAGVRNCLPFVNTWGHLQCFLAVLVTHLFNFLCCAVCGFFCFVCLRTVSCLSNLVIALLIAPSVFYRVYFIY